MLPRALDDLRFGPYIRLTATIFAALGMIVGVVGLLASLVGADVFIRLLPLLQVDGVVAGLLGLLVMPIFFALMGALVGAATFIPFRWLQRVFGVFEPQHRAGDAPSEPGVRTR